MHSFLDDAPRMFLETAAMTTIDLACEEAAEYATSKYVNVCFEFNGVMIKIDWDNDDEGLAEVNRYYSIINGGSA